jgi:hypothetical protein
MDLRATRRQRPAYLLATGVKPANVSREKEMSMLTCRNGTHLRKKASVLQTAARIRWPFGCAVGSRRRATPRRAFQDSGHATDAEGRGNETGKRTGAFRRNGPAGASLKGCRPLFHHADAGIASTLAGATVCCRGCAWGGYSLNRWADAHRSPLCAGCMQGMRLGRGLFEPVGLRPPFAVMRRLHGGDALGRRRL